MVIGKIQGTLGDAAPPALTPETGAAGLLLAASGEDARTEVGRQAVAGALMKLLHVPRPKAAALRAQAEALMAEGAGAERLAGAAASLPADDRDRLVGQLWGLADDAGTLALAAVRDAFGLTEERLAALRPR